MYPVVTGGSDRSGFFTDLFQKHHGWLLGWLKKKLDCPHHAADLAQDTFTRLLGFGNLPKLNEPRAYLLVTANRLLINHYHRRRVEDETLRAVAMLQESDIGSSMEEAAAARQLITQVIWLLTEEIDEKPRQAFLLARVDGLSYREIAERLKVSESSVKQYLARTLIHIHARLYGHHD